MPWRWIAGLHPDVPGCGTRGRRQPRRRRRLGRPRHVGTRFKALDELVWKLLLFFAYLFQGGRNLSKSLAKC